MSPTDRFQTDNPLPTCCKHIPDISQTCANILPRRWLVQRRGSGEGEGQPRHARQAAQAVAAVAASSGYTLQRAVQMLPGPPAAMEDLTTLGQWTTREFADFVADPAANPALCPRRRGEAYSGEPWGKKPGGRAPGGKEPGGREPGGRESGGKEPRGKEPGGKEPGGNRVPRLRRLFLKFLAVPHGSSPPRSPGRRQ
eukprot:gene5883-biopygen206